MVLSNLRRRGHLALIHATYLARLRWNGLEAQRFDRRHGTDTAGVIPMRELGVTGEAADHGTGFESVPARHLMHVFRTMEFPGEAGFVDIGSGKGRALFVANEYGFRPIVGIELDPELCTVADRNAKILGVHDRMQIERADATEHEFGEHRVAFMNNPFDEKLVTKVVDRAAAGFVQTNEPAWIVYLFPHHRDVLDRHPQWRFVQGFMNRGWRNAEILVYELNRERKVTT